MSAAELRRPTPVGARSAPFSGVVRVGQLLPFLENTLVSEFGAPRVPDDDGRAEFLGSYGPRVSVAVTSSKIGMSAELMGELPNLKAIVNCGVGYDSTDIALAKSRGIVMSNTPDVLSSCVADIAVALYLDVLRGVTAADRFVRRGDWLNGRFPLTTRAHGKRVGIIGLGRIGSAIAQRLDAFDCTVSYHSRNPIPGSRYRHVDSLRQLAEQSDTLIVAAAGGPGSAGLVSADILNALGPEGYLINIARGSIVDEHALIDAVSTGKIAGAGLDVFSHEPAVPAALLVLDNVVLLPHVGSGTKETRQAMAELTLANLRSFMEQSSLVTPIPC